MGIRASSVNLIPSIERSSLEGAAVTVPKNGQIIAVTGASGMLGRHLCAALASRGFTVRALARSPGSFSPIPGVSVSRCDLPDSIDEKCLDGASALVHCAYATRTTDLTEARRVNEEGTRRLFEASRRAGIPRFVFVSTIAAHPNAPNYYARSKHALEQICDPGRDLVVRPGLILAKEGQGLFQQMREGMRRTGVMPLFGGGRQPLQTVHVDDLCEAFVRALDRGLTGTLQVAEPTPPSFVEFLRLLAERIQVRCRFVPLPLTPFLVVVRLFEPLRIPFPIRSESLLGIRALRHVDVGEDCRRLGFVPRSARESLLDVV
jgi:nucleoside-diphosphate-sugar epimerase